MMETYAPHGSFITIAFLLSNDLDPIAFMKNMMRISAFSDKMRYNYC